MSAFRQLSRSAARKHGLLRTRHISTTSSTVKLEPSTVKYEMFDPDEPERVEYYVPGGYHPIQIGNEFHNRYAVVHKLGFGGCATTWLAHDNRTGRLVALKISIAAYAKQTVRESEILRRLARARSGSRLPGKALVQTILDDFSFSGPNGRHHCLVMDAARVNINDSKEANYNRALPLPAARAIAAQLVLAVQFVHSQGIVHGDLHAGNILLLLPPKLQHTSINNLYLNAGEPTREPVVRCDGAPLDPDVPSELIIPLWLGLASDELTLTDCPLILADFGAAFDPSTTNSYTCQTPRLLAPPEAYFAKPPTDSPLSFPADIWTLACTIWDLFGTSPPFEVFIPSLDNVTQEHVDTFGKLPERWWKRWENRSGWFDEDGRKNVKEFRKVFGNTARPWEKRFPGSIRRARKEAMWCEEKDLGLFEPDEEKAFGEMIKSMLVLEPGERASIYDVVGSEWMQGWGLPEIQRMQERVDEERRAIIKDTSC
ncbi:kinase-like domain-containing protein [Aspergillus californicus]